MRCEDERLFKEGLNYEEHHKRAERLPVFLIKNLLAQKKSNVLCSRSQALESQRAKQLMRKLQKE